MLLRFSSRHGKNAQGSLHSYDKHIHSESRKKECLFNTMTTIDGVKQKGEWVLKHFNPSRAPFGECHLKLDKQ